MSELAKGITTLVSGIVLTGFLIWGIVFMVGDIAKMQKEYNERVASEKQQEQVVSEDMHDPMVISEEGSYDDGTGSYGPHVRPNGKLGTGYDMGGGVVMKPNGGIGFGIDLGL